MATWGIGPHPAERRLDRFPGCVCARARPADVDPLTLEIFDVADPRVRAGQERQDRLQAGVGRTLPVSSTLEGSVLHIGLDESEIEGARSSPSTLNTEPLVGSAEQRTRARAAPD